MREIVGAATNPTNGQERLPPDGNHQHFRLLSNLSGDFSQG
jgi:hypothetical protein